MPNNPLYNLTAQKISFTYQNLLQTDGYGNYYNGLGDEIFIGGGTGYSPIVVQPGEFFQLVAKNLGTVTSAGTITFLVTVDGYME